MALYLGWAEAYSTTPDPEGVLAGEGCGVLAAKVSSEQLLNKLERDFFLGGGGGERER